ncbi:transglycosylase domain-containing protein [Acutalibacter sp. 1XD8-36]|uniref:transglycosylase domain-containing protein n=1 Tax=Acutalibacter sp. 1XD8-36 TaxID=2320852 RepID=UPI002616DFE4|nr:biosynthetic peptidoglycan transglycosylase [Acutalibacter sp. 1XD8-36]
MTAIKKKHTALKITRNIILIFFAVCIVAAGGVTLRGYYMYTGALEQKPIMRAVGEIRSKDSFTELSQLPDTYLDAVIAAEDHRFYEHGGVDYIAIGRAVYNDIKAMSFVEGGSTITQQLAKNLYFTQEKELTRKVAEVFMAWALESRLSKEEILELYVNSIYFGSGCYSVGEASYTYFDKAPSEMTDYESTLLAGIPNAPSVYDLNENPDLARQRQRQVVGLMVKYSGMSRERAELLACGVN